jgi:uncharacterized protein YjaG (DUF416 family)
MDSETKIALDKVLEKNELITDLSSFKISESMLVHVLEHAVIYTNILSIKWNETQLNEQSIGCKKLIEKIEDCLVTNNKTYDKFPPDSTYCVLTKLMYTYKTSEQSELKKKTTSDEEKTVDESGKFVRMFDKLTKEDWKIKGILDSLIFRF